MNLIMHSRMAASVNAFDFKAAILARHAQHPVIVHFPIALFIASAVFEVLAAWQKQPVFASVAYYNLLGAAISVPFTVTTGLLAWQFQLQGAALKGNLSLHFVFAITTAVIILILFWKRFRLRNADNSPAAPYFALMALGLMMITVTGHVGGILSGVETP